MMNNSNSLRNLDSKNLILRTSYVYVLVRIDFVN